MNSITSDTLNPLRSITSGTSVTIAETGGHDAPKRSVTINRNDRSRSPKYAGHSANVLPQPHDVVPVANGGMHICGILARGFARARCGHCGHDFLIAFSCKGRGVCPSCNARRMVATAAHLTDHVLPDLPVRQWVLAVPKRLRYFLHRDAGLQGAALRLFLPARRSPWTGCARSIPTICSTRAPNKVRAGTARSS